MSSGVGKYRLGPFLLLSELPLPELTLSLAQPERETVEVSIRYGTVPKQIEGVLANESLWWASKEEYLQRVPGVANFLVRHGREIVVEPELNSRALDVRAYLLAPIFTALCHQAGMYALHGSAVRVGDGVTAFLGYSGDGKSTLAAYLARRGYNVISDDMCLLDTHQEVLHVVPVAPSLKLWESAVEQLGPPREGLQQVFTGEKKFRMRLVDGEADGAGERLPLRQVYFLEWAADREEEASIAPTGGVQAIWRLMEFMHSNYLMKATDRQAESFALAGRVLKQANTFVFRRPQNFERIERAVDVLEAQLTTTEARPAGLKSD